MLLFERSVPVGLAPLEHRPDRTGEAILGGDLANDISASPRPSPHVGEAEKVERRVRIVPPQAPRPEVHIAGLCLMERQPVSTETFTQNVEHAPAAPGVVEGHHKVIGKLHELSHVVCRAADTITYRRGTERMRRRPHRLLVKQRSSSLARRAMLSHKAKKLWETSTI